MLSDLWRLTSFSVVPAVFGVRFGLALTGPHCADTKSVGCPLSRTKPPRERAAGPRALGNRRDCASVVSASRLLLGLAAMDDADQPAPTPEECRGVAAELRRMAEEAPLSEIRADLVDLAWRFDRMADLFEASMGPKAPPTKTS